MVLRYHLFTYTCICLLVHHIYCYFELNKNPNNQNCFCKLEGPIDDCACSIDIVDKINNVKIYPRLRSLLTKDYFRFYKVNLKKNCPLWSDDSHCTMKYCHVEACDEQTIPEGLKGSAKRTQMFKDTGHEKYSAETNCDDHDAELGYLNTTISAKTQREFALWKAFDDAQENFCIIDDDDNDAEYVDLLLNPERYTGYRGKSAHRIWNSIYNENCFRPDESFSTYIQSKILNNMCLEKRVFYRAISGLHASINIHLCAKYLKSSNLQIEFGPSKLEWGPNIQEFVKRFSPESTNGEGPNWLRNLYFLYLLELRALSKASSYLEKEEFYTGDWEVDWDTQHAVKDFLQVVKELPNSFNETNMFSNEETKKLKGEFKQHFRNISSIMDCVGCDKCKLWGKLQTQGLGTALKILFSGAFDETVKIGVHRSDYQLQRTEIVSLINSIGRLSTSIYELDEFRHMLR